MPDLNTDVSLFNLNNRGANASLQTARNTYNQLLTDMNWSSGASSANHNMSSASSTALGSSDRAVEAFNYGNSLFYTTDSPEYNYTPRSLWMTDGKTVTDLTNYLPNPDRNQQVIDIIGSRYESSASYLYFTRERIAATAVDSIPHNLELWKTDGTKTGTQLVKNWDRVNGNGSAATSLIKTTDSHYIVNDKIYIRIPGGSNGRTGFELWQSQGTADTTKELVAISSLVQRTPDGLGKVDPKDYGPLPNGYLNSLTRPIAKVQGSSYSGGIYFTLESRLNIYRQPGYSYYEVWTGGDNDSAPTKASEFNYYDALKPKDFIKSHLPSDLRIELQGDYGIEASYTTSVLGGRNTLRHYLDPNRSALVQTLDLPPPAWVIADFQDTNGYSTLSHLGAIFGDYGQPQGIYFVRNNDELWYTPYAYESQGVQKLFSTNRAVSGSTIEGLYKIGGDQLILMTSAGMRSVKITSEPDPTIELTNGNYRALRDLAREIGGEALAKEVVIPEFDTTGWSINGIRDYDGDGDVDIFWRHNASGQGVFWQMNGLKFEKGVIAGPQGDYSQWQVKGFGDFDRDGDQDIFWQHSSGLNVIWEMQGLKFKSGTVLPTTPTTDWYFSGIGNFNGDRNLEVLWRNREGTLVTWEIEGFKLKSGKVLSPNVGNSDTIGWYVQAVTDFDNDGDSDILWRNSKSEITVLWEMQGGQYKTGALLPATSSFGGFDERLSPSRPGYSLNKPRYGGQLDIDGDGKLDIWWQSPITGRREAWTFKRDSQNILSYAGTLTK
jgi:ELWxxDGT repeat protein